MNILSSLELMLCGEEGRFGLKLSTNDELTESSDGAVDIYQIYNSAQDEGKDSLKEEDRDCTNINVQE